MKLLVTSHAQMFQTPDGLVWTNSVYSYDFFKRYLEVFDEVRLVTRMKKISYENLNNLIKVSGPKLEFFPLEYYRGPWEYAKKYFKIQKALKKSIESCDCAVLRVPDQIAFQLFKKIKKNNLPCAIEVVAHSWDLYAKGTIDTKLRLFLRILWDINQKRICKQADGVSYVTEKYIQKRYPAKIKHTESNRFEAFYTSADIKPVFYGKPRSKEFFKKEIINFVHVSGINNTAKGHLELLNVLLELKKLEFKFTMTFIGGGTLLNKFYDISINKNLGNFVNFKGQLSNPNEIANILKSSDIFIFPTMTEGLPRVLLEAMASGLPCIATNVGGIPELLSDRAMIKTNSIMEIKDKMLYFSNNIDILVLESERNYNKVINEYSSKIIQKKRIEFYLKLKNLTIKNESGDEI